MDRPSRKTKTVNYSEVKEFDDDDDEDFACAKPPPSKKSKEALKQQTSKNSISQESNSSQKSRKSIDVKIYERDLEAAISLSMLNPSNKVDQSASKEDIIIQAPVDENTKPSALHLSNCSVDSICLGLDQIRPELSVPSKDRKEASDVQRNKAKTRDDDYQPGVLSESESDNDESGESEDEEFTVKKESKRKKQQVTKNGKNKQTQKQKKPQKSKATVASTPTRTPLTHKNTPEPARSTSLKVSKPPVCLSPGVSRVPKWNPPGQIGKSPSSSNSAPLRSPSQGLRLGLSRRVRVKPLHPSVANQ